MTHEALPARTLNEVRCYFLVTACPSCGKGPLNPQLPSGGSYQGPLAATASCRACGAQQDYDFIVQQALPAQPPRSELINLSDEPSRIIDLAQWLGLFYMLLSSADRQKQDHSVRRIGHQASLCLAEALKFYGDDELPPESAFFSPGSPAAFRQHPEKFARQRLRDMQAKLPSLAAMEQRLEQDGRKVRPRWWQFWRR
jgi:hypothetical protein